MKKLSCRKLDNTAKIFSLEDKKHNNTFRLSVVLKEQIDINLLKSSVIKSLDKYPYYKVKINSGFFWNYLEYNSKEIIIEQEQEIPCKSINFKKNNDYLFKVTYFNNKINLDVFHVLTDGKGATILLKEILYNYFNIKYNLNTIIKENTKENIIDYKDEYLKNANKSLLCKEKIKKAFQIQEKSNLSINKTYHYILNLEQFKKIVKKHNVTITEYLTTIYIYALYKSIYNKQSNKDLIIAIPIDLRKHYQVETFSNFFTCMNIEGNISNNKNITFTQILNQVHKEFKEKLTKNNIECYLSRDVKLGTNTIIKIIPLCIKKLFIKYLGGLLNKSTTSTLSNIGTIKIHDKYRKYIDNIMAIVNTRNFEKIKCTICSYENNLTITINSNLINNNFENNFYNILKKYIGKFKLESESDKRNFLTATLHKN